MAFSHSFVISGKRMIKMFVEELIFGSKRFYNIFKFIKNCLIMTKFFKVFLELSDSLKI